MSNTRVSILSGFLKECQLTVVGHLKTSVHLLPAVAIHSVAFSGKSVFMLDSSGAFIKAYLEMHALITMTNLDDSLHIFMV